VIPEEKAALIVWRIMVPSVPFEEFERHLLKQRRPEWNQAANALANLAQAAGSIHLTVEAHKPEGFEPGWLQNAVLDPLDELDVEVEENRENGQKET